jgi:hypothetical protein
MDDARCKTPCTMECSPDAWLDRSRWRWESVSEPYIDQSWNNLSGSEKFSRSNYEESPSYVSIVLILVQSRVLSETQTNFLSVP